MFKRIALSTALLATPVALLAQSRPATPPAAPSLTGQQAAAVQHQDQMMAQGAVQVARLIDQGQAGEIWDGASPVAKQAVTRDAFVKQVMADRATVGTPVSRKLAAITRSESKGGSTPAGYYINVSFATQFSKEKQPVRELVSFHLDNDKTWRVSGYTLR